MKKLMSVSFLAASLLTLPGASVVNLPCAKSPSGDLVCFCQPGGTNCRCTRVAIDKSGVETW